MEEDQCDEEPRRDKDNPEHVEFANVDIGDPKILSRQSNRRRRSPIMVEFADPAITPVDLQQAMEAGMNIVKFRMAYSTKSEKVYMLGKVDKAANGAGVKTGYEARPTATCATLKTWMIKTGVVGNELGLVVIQKDSEVVLTNKREFIHNCTDKQIFVDYANLAVDVQIGMEISINQGELIMLCTQIIDDQSIKCKISKGGILKNLQPVSIRNLVHSTPFIKKSDVEILKFCCQYQLEMLIVYYVPDGEMIKKIKHLLSKSKTRPLIFSAICTQQGLDNLGDIVTESDGIIFARELLQYELDSSKHFRMIQIQKWIGGMCWQAGKPLFVSGGVFQETLTTGEISDAEVSDVTNALMDGITGFILKECYDINNTILAINELNEICCSVEPLTFNKKDFWRILMEPKMPVNAADAAIISCVTVANQTNSRVIIIPTVTGRTARGLLWLRPSCIVITVSTQLHTARMLSTYRNIVPLIYKGPTGQKYYRTIDSRVLYAAHFAVSRSWLKQGDVYISLQRSSDGLPYCDMVRIWNVTFSKKLLVECHYSDDASVDGIPGILKSDSVPAVKKKKKRKHKREKEVEPIENGEELQDKIEETAQEGPLLKQIRTNDGEQENTV